MGLRSLLYSYKKILTINRTITSPIPPIIDYFMDFYISCLLFSDHLPQHFSNLKQETLLTSQFWTIRTAGVTMTHCLTRLQSRLAGAIVLSQRDQRKN
jgi:hypothetical protein